MNNTNFLLKLIKIYPGVAIILISILLALGGYWFKSRPITINKTEEKIVYLKASPNIIIGDKIKIEKKDGHRWLNGALMNYIFVVSGEQRFSIVVDIMANNKCDECIDIENNDKTIVLYIDDNDAMCFFDYCQRYAKK